MRIQALQHVPFEGPARIAAWAGERGHALRATHLFRGEELPPLDQFDLLVVMGGPMSVNDEAEHSWLAPEQHLVEAAIRAGKAVFGVCLGAQLIAAALGERVYPGDEKEIGWFPVRGCPVPNGSPAFAGFPRAATPLHWHGETFDLPPGGVRLAETSACPNQAFQIGDRVIGTQFHLEATPESVRALVDNAAGDITGGPFQQDPSAILAQAPEATAATRPILFAMLDAVATRVAG